MIFLFCLFVCLMWFKCIHNLLWVDMNWIYSSSSSSLFCIFQWMSHCLFQDRWLNFFFIFDLHIFVQTHTHTYSIWNCLTTTHDDSFWLSLLFNNNSIWIIVCLNSNFFLLLFVTLAPIDNNYIECDDDDDDGSQVMTMIQK